VKSPCYVSISRCPLRVGDRPSAPACYQASSTSSRTTSSAASPLRVPRRSIRV
jgi:hypothetical protein